MTTSSSAASPPNANNNASPSSLSSRVVPTFLSESRAWGVINSLAESAGISTTTSRAPSPTHERDDFGEMSESMGRSLSAESFQEAVGGDKLGGAGGVGGGRGYGRRTISMSDLDHGHLGGQVHSNPAHANTLPRSMGKSLAAIPPSQRPTLIPFPSSPTGSSRNDSPGSITPPGGSANASTATISSPAANATPATSKPISKHRHSNSTSAVPEITASSSSSANPIPSTSNPSKAPEKALVQVGDAGVAGGVEAKRPLVVLSKRHVEQACRLAGEALEASIEMGRAAGENGSEQALPSARSKREEEEEYIVDCYFSSLDYLISAFPLQTTSSSQTSPHNARLRGKIHRLLEKVGEEGDVIFEDVKGKKKGDDSSFVKRLRWWNGAGAGVISRWTTTGNKGGGKGEGEAGPSAEHAVAGMMGAKEATEVMTYCQCGRKVSIFVPVPEPRPGSPSGDHQPNPLHDPSTPASSQQTTFATLLIAATVQIAIFIKNSPIPFFISYCLASLVRLALFLEWRFELRKNALWTMGAILEKMVEVEKELGILRWGAEIGYVIWEACMKSAVAFARADSFRPSADPNSPWYGVGAPRVPYQPRPRTRDPLTVTGPPDASGNREDSNIAAAKFQDFVQYGIPQGRPLDVNNPDPVDGAHGSDHPPAPGMIKTPSSGVSTVPSSRPIGARTTSNDLPPTTTPPPSYVSTFGITSPSEDPASEGSAFSAIDEGVVGGSRMRGGGRRVLSTPAEGAGTPASRQRWGRK